MSVMSCAAGILTSDMSARFGGTDKKVFAFHTETVYWHDLICVIPEMQRQFASKGIHLRYLLEELLENLFAKDHLAQELTRNDRSLGPQIRVTERHERRARINPKKKKNRMHRTDFRDAPVLPNIVFLACLQNMRTVVRVIDGGRQKKKGEKKKKKKHKKKTWKSVGNPLPIAHFAFWSFVRFLPLEDKKMSYKLPNQDVYFPTGQNVCHLDTNIQTGSFVNVRYCLCGIHPCQCNNTKNPDILVLCGCHERCDIYHPPILRPPAVQCSSASPWYYSLWWLHSVTTIQRDFRFNRVQNKIMRELKITEMEKMRWKQAEAKFIHLSSHVSHTKQVRVDFNGLAGLYSRLVHWRARFDPQNPPLIPVHLCLRDAAIRTVAGCKCTTTNCRSCSCAVSNLRCTSECHKGTHNTNCIRC